MFLTDVAESVILKGLDCGFHNVVNLFEKTILNLIPVNL